MQQTVRLSIFLALSACASGLAASEGSLASMVTEELVKEALLEKGAEAASPIQVTMDRSTAILTGDVRSKVVQELAAEVALSVDGVKRVDNRLRVVGEKELSELSSEDMVAHTAAELADATLESSIKIELYKEIGTNARKTIALDTVRKMKDVKKVLDLIEVE